MANLKLSALILLSIFVFSAYAQGGAQGANEVDTQACTRDATNMMWYCQGYCELQSNQSCDYDYDFGYPVSTDSGIEQCNCKCGVGGELKTYDNVPCGIDLMRKWSPSNTDHSSDFNPSCCLPAFALLGVFGIAYLRR